MAVKCKCEVIEDSVTEILLRDWLLRLQLASLFASSVIDLGVKS